MFGKLSEALKNLDADAIVEKAAPMLDKVLGNPQGSNPAISSSSQKSLPPEQSYAHLGGKRKALLIGINYTGIIEMLYLVL